MRTELELVFETYRQARSESFARHPTADFVRTELRDAFQAAIASSAPDFSVESSAGKGGWTDTPWVAVLDPLVTDTPQTGVYIVYLFAAPMDRLYLSLNQGITTYRNRYGTTISKGRLRQKAKEIRQACPQYSERFNANQIHLGTSNLSSRAAFYEVGHVFGTTYTPKLPSESELQADLAAMIRLYRATTFSVIPGDVGEGSNEATSEPERFFEFNDRMRFHRCIERNDRLAKRVKDLQGTICKACNFDYEVGYGQLGKGFIEAHHITPLADFPRDRAVPLDPRRDFTVLCANCHRMTHRKQPPLSLAELKALLKIEGVRPGIT